MMGKKVSAPLTTAALGSTRCVGCEKRFADAPGEVVETVAEVENRGRVDSIGQRHRGIGTHAETRRWHRACLEDFERRNDALRRQVRIDQLEMVVSIFDQSGREVPTDVARELESLREQSRSVA